MARNIKKVKVQKKSHTKKFWAILYSLIAAGILLVAGLITLIVVLTNKKEESYDYFSELPKDSFVTAEKLTGYSNDSAYEHIFVYYFDNTFDPEDNKSDKEKEEKVIALYNAVKEYNEKSSKETTVAFFVINTSKATGSGALNNETLGNLSASNQLAYMCDGTYTQYAYNTKDGDILSGATLSELRAAISFVTNLK